MANMALEFNLLARDNASRALRDVGNAADRTGHQVEGAAGGFSRMGSAALVAGGALLAGGGLVRGLASLYEAADESRKIASRTENVIAQMGNTAGLSAQQVGELAESIAAKTGVDDEAIQSGQNLLLTFGNLRDEAGEGNDIFTRTSELMVDLSAAMGTDASGSAVQLGKALNDPVKGITALTRVGVSFTAQQKDQIRALSEAGDLLGAQKIILGELEKQFGGAAEAMATPLDKLRVNAGNLAEDLGGYLLPVVDDVATSLNDGLLPSASELGPQLQSAAESVADLVPEMVSLVETGLDLATDVLPLMTSGLSLAVRGAEALGPALPAVVTGFAGMKIAGAVGDGVGSLGSKLERAGVVSGSAAGKMKDLGAALPVVGIAIGGLVTAIGQGDRSMQQFEDSAATLFATIRQGGPAADGARAALERMQEVSDQIGDQSFLGFGTDFPQAMQNSEQAAEDFTASLTPLQQATEEVTYWTNELAGRTADSSYVLRDQNGDVVSLTEAQAALSDATSTQTTRQNELTDITAAATGTTDVFTQGLQDAADAAKDAQDQTNLLKGALDALTGANVSVDQATANYYSSLDAATASLGELSGGVVANNGLLDLSSERGREVADRLIELSDNSHGFLAALQAQGAGQQEVTARDAELRDSFFQTARQLTGNDEAARQLTDRYYGMPDQVVTTIIADTGPAVATIEAFKRDLAGGLALTVPQLGIGFNRAEGGPIYGPGTGTSDSIPAWLSNGEYVVKADSVRRYGLDFMEAVNAGSYATGGLINPFPDPIIQPLGLSAAAAGAVASFMSENGKGGRALSWARSQVGKPYIWGGVGPMGYDCSGFMSAITNVLNGKSPHSRVGATATFPWAGFAGGYGAFTVGSTPNAGGGIGHMAGTLMGVNVESRGSDGVVVGPNARGASNGLFRTRAHLATFDSGGVLEPGYTLAYNGTGRGERVLTSAQESASRQTTINVTSNWNERDIARAVDQQLKQQQALAPAW